MSDTELANAPENVEHAWSLLDRSMGSPRDALNLVTEAGVHATLALVEQQRIANLMAYLVLIDESPGPEDDKQIRQALGLDQ